MNDIDGVSASGGTMSGIPMRDLAAAPSVRLDRRFLLFSLVATMLLSWPILVFGRPSYIQDSAAYYKGGRAAVNYALAKVSSPEAPTVAKSGEQDSASKTASQQIPGSDIKA